MTATRPEISVFDVETYGNGDPTTFGLPLDQYAYLQDNEPCLRYEFNDPMLVDWAWVLTRHEDIWNVDRNAELYAADRGFVNMWRITPVDPKNGGMPSMLTMDGPDHRRNRQVLARGFTPGVVQRLAEKFQQYAEQVVTEALKVGTFNFVHDIAHMMPMEALGDVLGVPPADRPKFFSWVDTFAAPFDTRVTPSFDAVLESIGNILVYATELKEIRTLDPGDDVMSAIVRAGEEEKLSDDEIMGNVALLASGAAESTRTSLSHGMHELMRNPEQMAWMREHASDVPASAINEMVRIASPFTHLVRTATADHELHGQQISEGDIVLMLFAAGNFDPRAFDAPQNFDLARDPNPHLGFGRGPHTCLGKHVAILEMQILLRELFTRTKEIRPAGEVSYVRDAYSRGVYELPVTVVPA